MSTIARIKCYNCTNVFDFYFNLRESEQDIICPHCLTKMDHQSTKFLLSVMGEYSDVNCDFRRWAAEGRDKLFQFDLLTVDVREKSDIIAEIEKYVNEREA